MVTFQEPTSWYTKNPFLPSSKYQSLW